MSKHTTRIEVETEEFTIIRVANPQARQSWCARCEAGVVMLTPEEIVGVARATFKMERFAARAVYRLIETAILHFVETPSGDMFICLPSFLAHTAACQSSHASNAHPLIGNAP